MIPATQDEVALFDLHRILTAAKEAIRLRDELHARINEITNQLRSPFRFAAFADIRARWARETFPNQTVEGVLRHLEKEIAEVRAEDLTTRDGRKNTQREAVDIILLGMEVFARAGGGGLTLEAAIQEKHTVNLSRKWPSAELQIPNEPVEHVR